MTANSLKVNFPTAYRVIYKWGKGRGFYDDRKSILEKSVTMGEGVQKLSQIA